MWPLFIGGTVIWYSIQIYLKYQLVEVNEQVQFSLKYRNTNSLMRAILKHNYVAKTVKDLNKIYKYVLLILYSTTTLAIDLSLFIVTGSESNTYLKIVCILFSLTIFILIFALTYLSALVMKLADSPRPFLYSFLVRNKILIRQKMKIKAFINRLSKHEIGFYCLDLFAMNNREFFNFCSQFFVTYMLLVRLI